MATRRKKKSRKTAKRSPPQKPSFRILPDPPHAGQPVKIWYDGPLPVTVTVLLTPGGPTQYEIETVPLVVDLPDSAVSMLLTDESGAADDLATSVT